MKRAGRAKQWAKYIAGWESSGLTQRQYCERETISYDTFKRWRHQLREDRFPGTSRTRWVPVTVLATGRG